MNEVIDWERRKEIRLAQQDNEPTEHGDNVAGEVQEDVYGLSGTLTVSDVWRIIDAIHTNRLDGRGGQDKLLGMLGDFLDKVIEEFPDAETY